MKSVRMASGLVVLALALILALVLALAVYAQGPAGDETEEEGGIGGQGLHDPPVPGYTVLYMFTGAADNSNGADTIATSVHCTNYGGSNVVVIVEVADADNIPVISGTLTLNPNVTATFSSQNTALYYDTYIMASLGGDEINQGSGRIMANSSSAQLICTAQTLDPNNNPPEYGVKLSLFDGNGNLVGVGRASKIYLPIILKNS